MMESVKLYLEEVFSNNPGKCVGTVAGMFWAICILLFGFWKMFFIILLGLVGLFIGFNVDREGNFWDNVQECIPKDFHRFR